MTVRAIVLGLLGAAAIACLGFLNDSVLGLTPLVGNHLPISVFGLLILIVIGVNPLLAALRSRWRLQPGELATVMTFMLVACSIPGSGMLRTFTPMLAMPVSYNETKPGWQRARVLDRLPADMVVPRIESKETPGRLLPDPEVMGPLSTGYANTSDPLPLTEVFSARVPWGKWSGPLGMWVPLVLLMSIGVICLSLIVHPQWSKREHLRYPIADFATTLMRDDPRAEASLLRNSLFWVGLIAILAIHAVNGIHAWYPQFIQVPLEFDFSAISRAWPYLQQWGGSYRLFHVALFPTVIAFSFFLASDVSFSLGISRILPGLILPALILRGVPMEGSYVRGGGAVWATFGAYLGAGGLLLYVGRRYYWQTLRCALTFRRAEDVEAYSVWACRGLLLCLAGMFCIFVFRMELAWPLALMVILLIYLAFTVLSRMSAESGLFFLKTSWVPLAPMLGLFGVSSLGPEAILVVGMISCVLLMDPRECLMPFMVTGLKMCEITQVKEGKVGLASPIVYVLAFAAALPVVLWSNYNHGMPMRDTYATRAVPQSTFDVATAAIGELQTNDELQASEQRGALGRLSGLWEHHARKRQFLIAAGVGFALYVLVSVLRLRYAWWPIHPILFLVWSTYPLARFSHSFLIGWALRTVVERLGGTPAYRRARVLMIGCVAGDLLGGLIFLTHGGIYSILTGMQPEVYRIFPG